MLSYHLPLDGITMTSSCDINMRCHIIINLPWQNQNKYNSYTDKNKNKWDIYKDEKIFNF